MMDLREKLWKFGKQVSIENKADENIRQRGVFLKTDNSRLIVVCSV